VIFRVCRNYRNPFDSYDENGTVMISVGGKTLTLGQFTNASMMVMDKGEGSGGWLAFKDRQYLT
jgi:hypothetical protein